MKKLTADTKFKISVGVFQFFAICQGGCFTAKMYFWWGFFVVSTGLMFGVVIDGYTQKNK